MEFAQEQDIKKALDTLNSGGIILYPTDTIWGIGCDATNPEAVEKVYAIKKRSLEKSLIILLHTDYQLQSYLKEVPEIAYELIEYSDKPLTVVYSEAKNLAENLIAPDGSIGIRVVDHPFCTPLLQRFRKPIVSTSANFSGQPNPKNFNDISDDILSLVDYVAEYGQHQIKDASPSTIMRLHNNGEFKFLRK